MTNTTDIAPINPDAQTRDQRFWLIDNGFRLVCDTLGETWLYMFEVKGKGYCVGIYRGEWSVYRCGPTATTVLFTGDSFKAVLTHALGMMRA